MDTSTGHLVRNIEQIPEPDRARYTRVPAKLLADAEKALADFDEVTVPMDWKTNLANWARRERLKKRIQKLARKERR